MNDVSFFWDGWAPLIRIVVVGTLGYSWLVLLLRMSGQRTFARMTPFDFVITVTLGSAFGRVLTATEVSLSEAALTFAVLVVLQWVFAFLRQQPLISRALNRDPSLLYHDGRVIEGAMRRHRLNEEDLLSAVRSKGMRALTEAEAIILENDGTFSVINPGTGGESTALAPVEER